MKLFNGRNLLKKKKINDNRQHSIGTFDHTKKKRYSICAQGISKKLMDNGSFTLYKRINFLSFPLLSFSLPRYKWREEFSLSSLSLVLSFNDNIIDTTFCCSSDYLNSFFFLSFFFFVYTDRQSKLEIFVLHFWWFHNEEEEVEWLMTSSCSMISIWHSKTSTFTDS